MATTSTEWQQIEDAAREVVALEMDRREQTPLAFGELIAWAYHRFGLTDALSSVHRVGYPIGDAPYTTCGEAIPAPIAWLALSPALARSMAGCRFCEAEYVRAVQAAAA